jgi:hypothetical protein
VAAETRAEVGAGEREVEGDRPFYVPSTAKAQFAGNVGMIALGGGWSWWERRVDLDLLAGWVPPMNGSSSIWSITLKPTFWPARIDLPHGWRLRPISVGGTATYTLGDRFFLFQPDRYPKGYYPVNTALRIGAFLGGSVGKEVSLAPLAGVDLYWEVGFTDLELYLFVLNPHARSLFDTLHGALGIAVSF